MIDFDQLELSNTNKYWYILYIPTDQVVYLPFKREFEKQTFFLCEKTKQEIDNSSYWIEGVANKLLSKLILDNPLLKHEDFKVIEYEEVE